MPMKNDSNPIIRSEEVTIDIRAIGEQMGVGGDDSWGANVHPEYIPDVTQPKEFTFTFCGI